MKTILVPLDGSHLKKLGRNFALTSSVHLAEGARKWLVRQLAEEETLGRCCYWW